MKLKEITYIHAEAYAAGELKHGPLALVTSEMPVVAVAPNDALLEKLKSNLHEVRARGGVLYVLADADTKNESVVGRISGKVKGGFTVDIKDVRAFLPGSLVDVRPVRDPLSAKITRLRFLPVRTAGVFGCMWIVRALSAV